MENEEEYNITNAKTAASNFKIKDGHRDFIKRFGMNMSGNGRRSPISKTNTNAVKKQSEEYWTKLRSERKKTSRLKKLFAFLTLLG